MHVYTYKLQLQIVLHMCIYTYCRASHTGDTRRVMYSSVRVGLCSARARRCKAQCDVLFIPQLVTVLPHISCPVFLLVLSLLLVLLLLVLLVVVAVAATPRIFAFSWDPNNRQIGGVFMFFFELSVQQTP